MREMTRSYAATVASSAEVLDASRAMAVVRGSMAERLWAVSSVRHAVQPSPR